MFFALRSHGLLSNQYYVMHPARVGQLMKEFPYLEAKLGLEGMATCVIRSAKAIRTEACNAEQRKLALKMASAASSRAAASAASSAANERSAASGPAADNAAARARGAANKEAAAAAAAEAAEAQRIKDEACEARLVAIQASISALLADSRKAPAGTILPGGAGEAEAEALISLAGDLVKDSGGGACCSKRCDDVAVAAEALQKKLVLAGGACDYHGKWNAAHTDVRTPPPAAACPARSALTSAAHRRARTARACHPSELPKKARAPPPFARSRPTMCSYYVRSTW